MRHTLLLALCSLILVVPVQARDLDQDEALRLRQKGVILPLEQLLQQALAPLLRLAPAGGRAGGG